MRRSILWIYWRNRRKFQDKAGDERNAWHALRMGSNGGGGDALNPTLEGVEQENFSW